MSLLLLSRLKEVRAKVKREAVELGKGKRLEFLLQEMLREINTTGVKSQDKDVSRLIVDSKALLEKLREQVLNVE